MAERLLLLASRVVGDLKHDSLEHRLFNAFSLLNGVLNIAGAFPLLFLEEYQFVFFLSLGTGVLFLVFYYFSRFRSIYRTLYWPFILTLIAYLVPNAIGNAGSMGGAHYYLIPALVIAVILSRSRKQTILAVCLFLATTGGLLWVEKAHADWIRPYANMDERTMDVWSNYAFVQIFTGAVVLILMGNLNNERKKSDQLLRNVLPESVADELKKHDKVEPLHYDSATVFFTDFVGFTQIAERLSPAELIHELDECFSRFDSVVSFLGLEKIKTIGDAYMCVGGIPSASRTHAADAVRAALEIRTWMEEQRRRHEAAGRPFWELRVGIHTGPLVAGVIGRNKFAYDVWGDTVNTASRMESSGEKGRVNISGATYALVSDLFVCTHRGRIAAKNKGEIDMYFVERIRPEFSSDAGGIRPNTLFHEKLQNLTREGVQSGAG